MENHEKEFLLSNIFLGESCLIFQAGSTAEGNFDVLENLLIH